MALLGFGDEARVHWLRSESEIKDEWAQTSIFQLKDILQRQCPRLVSTSLSPWRPVSVSERLLELSHRMNCFVFQWRLYFISHWFLYFHKNHKCCSFGFIWILCFIAWTKWQCCAVPAWGHYCENTGNKLQLGRLFPEQKAVITVSRIIVLVNRKTENWEKAQAWERIEPHALSGYQMTVNRQLSLACEAVWKNLSVCLPVK